MPRVSRFENLRLFLCFFNRWPRLYLMVCDADRLASEVCARASAHAVFAASSAHVELCML